jgi:hypothetical protein
MRTSPTSGRERSRLAWIHVGKLGYGFVTSLEDAGLGVRSDTWFGVAPAIAEVYMSALASRLATASGLDAVTDQSDSLLFAAQWTVDELVGALVGGRSSVAVGAVGHPEWRLALCSVELVLPDSIASIPVERIIDIRRESDLAFQKFRTRIAEMRATLAMELDGIEDLETAESIVRDVRDRTIGVDLEDLRQTLRAQNLVTGTQHWECRSESVLESQESRFPCRACRS